MEVMVVVAMAAVLGLLASPILSTDAARTDARDFSLEASDAVREAQASVMAGKDNAKFGVHFEGTKFVFFEGATYSSSDANNVVHSIGKRVTVTAVALSGGSCTLPAGSGNCDLHFTDHKGTPTETGSVTFTGDDGTVRTLTVNAAGMVDVN